MGRLGAPNREPHTECQTGAWAQHKGDKRVDGGNELCENITREALPYVTIDGLAATSGSTVGQQAQTTRDATNICFLSIVDKNQVEHDKNILV